jgi:hypothetical protein
LVCGVRGSAINFIAESGAFRKTPLIVMNAGAGNKTYICFYSNKCKFCEYFLKELATMPFKGQFHFVCVDPSPNRPQIPSVITQVPAILVKGEANPYLANEAINWLAVKKMEYTPAKAPAGAGPAAVPEEPEAYFANEMRGYSSAFTYIDNQQQELGGTIGSFEYLGGGGAGVSTTAPNHMVGGGGGGSNQGQQGSVAGTDRVSQKERMFNKQMEEYMLRRDQGVPQQVKRQ